MLYLRALSLHMQRICSQPTNIMWVKFRNVRNWRWPRVIFNLGFEGCGLGGGPGICVFVALV